MEYFKVYEAVKDGKGNELPDNHHELSKPHNHESNGQAERAIREVKNLLKKN